MTELETKIYKKIIKEMDVDESTLEGFDENSPLFAGKDGNITDKVSMNLDSIDSLEMTLMIEKEWGIEEIPASKISQLDTIKNIADYLIEEGKA